MDFGVVGALENMVIRFFWGGTEGATVVSVGFAPMNSGSARKFFPTEFVKEGPGTGIFGVNGRESIPINRIENGRAPFETLT